MKFAYIYKYILPRWGTFAKELKVATSVMQSSSNELRTSVSESVNCKQKGKEGDSFGVRFPTDVKLTGFRSQLEAFRVSSHTEDLWYNETVYL